MRKVKWLIAGFVLMLCFFFGITLLLPSIITVSKSIIINAPPLAVTGQIKDFDKWKNWNPAFQEKDISVTNPGKENSSLNHSVQLFDKEGRNITFRLLPSTSDTIKINLQTNDKKATDYQFILLPDGKGHTLLIWNINTTLGWYPWERIQGLVMDKITGPAYTSALQELKKTVEKHAEDSFKK